jgi:hypothetical protein
MRSKTGRWFRYQYLRLVRQDDTPERVAGGLALGVALGVLPSFGLGIIIVIFLSGWLRLNRAAGVIGALVMNPWTTPLFWAASYLVGSLVIGNNIAETLAIVNELKSQGDLWSHLLAKRLLLPYIIGNIIVTVCVSAVFYVVGFWAVRAYRRAKAIRREHRRQRSR